MSLRHLALVLPFLVAPVSAQDPVHLAKVFGDHMVLQREANPRVWGWAAPGTSVVVTGSWNDEAVETTAGDDGAWEVSLTTGAAGGPYTLTVNDIELENVMLGEVWICSGQSNMEWFLSWLGPFAKDEVRAAEHIDLRLFKVPQELAAEPKDDAEGAWYPCVPQTAAVFSAVGYYFGRELHRELRVPVGLIHTAWGGTPIEAWTSAETIARFPEFAPDLERLANIDSEPSAEDLQAAWWQNLMEVDIGFRAIWMGDDFDGKSWRPAKLPGTFRESGLAEVDGCVWFRRVVPLPDDWVGQDLVLDLGPVDDMDITFFNGQQIGETRVHGEWQTPRAYPIPGAVTRPGSNVITVCAVDTAGFGSVGKAGAVRSKMLLRLATQESGEGIPIGGTWQVRLGATMADLGPFPHEGPLHTAFPTILYNSMIAPLARMTMRGVIWYQGESNVTRAAQYRRLFPALIEDWRARWGQGDFPFYFVQIAPYQYLDDRGQAAELREAQTMALAVPNTGMAVTMDIGDPADIHPRNKLDVGRRLAALALTNAYGRELPCQSPLYASMSVEGSDVRLRFAHADGLTSGDEAPSHFTVAGDDQVFHPGTARIEDDTVVVSSPAVPEPVAVRYAWGAADVPNLRNGAGLPAPSFRTDDWPMVSLDG